MLSSSREEIQEDFDALHTVVSRVVGHSFDVLTAPERPVLLGGWCFTWLTIFDQETSRFPAE